MGKCHEDIGDHLVIECCVSWRPVHVRANIPVVDDCWGDRQFGDSADNAIDAFGEAYEYLMAM